jgi:hypothetical protein
MRRFQLVFRSGRVIKRPSAPGARAVARIATRPKGLLVLVVFLVARITFFWRVFVTLGQMALVAIGDRVASSQRKNRFAVVEAGAFPRLVVVATLTFFAQLCFVFVVFFVASRTNQRRSTEALQILVASRALQPLLGVAVFQFKLRFAVVEQAFGRFPILGIVAIGTSLAQVAIVLVHFFVAAETILGRFFEHLRGVAFLALNLFVLANQWEVCFCVVELHGLFPTLLAMATLTLVAQ